MNNHSDVSCAFQPAVSWTLSEFCYASYIETKEGGRTLCNWVNIAIFDFDYNSVNSLNSVL